MSTRSVIGYETQTGSYVGVYCHFNGYKSHMMPQLEEMSWAAVKCEVDSSIIVSWNVMNRLPALMSGDIQSTRTHMITTTKSASMEL